jgi:xanthine dehydrogenase accessory factor
MNEKKFYNKFIDCLKNNKKYYLLICVQDKNNFSVGDKFLVNDNNEIVLKETVKSVDINLSDFKFEEKFNKDIVEINSIRFYIEIFKPADRIIIFGAGHVSVALAELLKQFNFQTVVADDREELFENFGDTIQKVVINFHNIKEKINVNENDYLVIVTRGHMYDKLVLQQVINKKVKYIGMIGSRKRVFSVKQLMLQEKFDETKLKEIFAPIGLPISGNAISEIALSIVSEIICVKNNKIKKLKQYCDKNEFKY